MGPILVGPEGRTVRVLQPWGAAQCRGRMQTPGARVSHPLVVPLSTDCMAQLIPVLTGLGLGCRLRAGSEAALGWGQLQLCNTGDRSLGAGTAAGVSRALLQDGGTQPPDTECCSLGHGAHCSEQQPCPHALVACSSLHHPTRSPAQTLGPALVPIFPFPAPGSSKQQRQAILGHLVAISSFHYSWRRHMGEGTEPALAVQDCKGDGRE